MTKQSTPLWEKNLWKMVQYFKYKICAICCHYTVTIQLKVTFRRTRCRKADTDTSIFTVHKLVGIVLVTILGGINIGISYRSLSKMDSNFKFKLKNVLFRYIALNGYLTIAAKWIGDLYKLRYQNSWSGIKKTSTSYSNFSCLRVSYRSSWKTLCQFEIHIVIDCDLRELACFWSLG